MNNNGKNATKKNGFLRAARYGVCTAIFALALFLAGNTALAASSDTAGETDKKTTVKADTASKKKTGKIITKKGKKYYKNEKGKIVKSRFVEIKKKTYYFGKNGVMEKGWIKKGGEYYYLDRKTGVQKTGCKVDGIKLKKDGKAQKTTYNKKKIETMIEAKRIMNSVTKTTDTKKEKLKKVFDWVLKHHYRQYRTLRSAKAKGKGWEITFANDIFKKGWGCCVSEASAFAFLAHECGYTSYICDDTGHAWTEIDGRVYDTLFAEAKSYSRYYGSSYQTAQLHRVNKLKI